MKNQTKLIYVTLLAFFGLTMTSCSDDDPIDPIVDPTDPEENVLDPEDLQGEITEEVSMTASETYHLTGILSVESGAILTIPAGTEIIADTDEDSNPATGIYIVVHQGGKINIEGTADKPVVMTAASGETGSWGGLILAGNALTTAGVDATAEVGGILYGGNTPDDNSGTIEYLIISDAGAQVDAESQYNGLSLYAVGSGTSISNVAMMNGADDGVEFFGGSVSINNLYLENNEDDAVDWTEGWDGSLQNVYVYHDIENFSTALEADGQNNNPHITNFTAVSTTGGTGLQFKAQSGAAIEGLSLSGYETTVDITEEGRTDLSGIQLNDADADPEALYDGEATVSADDFLWIQE